MFIELHMLQNIPPANLNRDDTNTPKDCEFGGVRRARVSSQSWKRAIRFHDAMRSVEGLTPSTRTKLLFEGVARELADRGRDRKRAEETTKAVLKATGFKLKENKKKDDSDDEPEGATSILYYVSEDVFSSIADVINEHWDSLVEGEKTDPEVLKRVAVAVAEQTQSPDLALFGRMIAEKPDKELGKQNLNVNASCQVAHAISTNRVSMEEDFFTAVDDLQPDSETGAGMMGVVDFNSSCFYRYMVVDTSQLTVNLNGNAELARRTVTGFIRAAVEAIPSGKQNTFAAHTPPDLVQVMVRSGLPVSLANAFVKPVSSDYKEDLVHNSIERLNSYSDRVRSVYGQRGKVFDAYVSLREQEASALGERLNDLDALIERSVDHAFSSEV